MRLADDDRARVPFAVVAVLLLVGSATMAATLRGRAPGGADPDVEAAVERASASARSSLSVAVERAARLAANDPVTVPANTTYGRVLGDPDWRADAKTAALRDLRTAGGITAVMNDPRGSIRNVTRRVREADPFWDYLRLRVYLSARRAFARVDERVDGVRASASLPGIDGPEDLRAALARVNLTTVDGTLHVEIRNVTLTAVRGGKVLVRENRTYRVAVETPVVELHQRVRRFETRLDRGPTEGPGLGRRLTGWLYSLAWARGYAQYGGVPIRNVVTNRHVELLTNEAVLHTQTTSFGGRDPEGAAALRRATALVGTYDLLAAGVPQGSWVTSVLFPYSKAGNAVSLAESDAGIGPGVGFDTPSPGSNMTVGVNRTADFAFVDVVDGRRAKVLPQYLLENDEFVRRVNRLGASGRNDSLAEQVRSWYAARARLATSVDPVRAEDPPPLRPPGEGWTLVRERNETESSVTPATYSGVDAPDGWVVNGTYARRVEVTHTAERTWVRGDRAEWVHGNRSRLVDQGRVRNRSVEWTSVVHVDLALLTSRAPTPPDADRPSGTPAPDRPIDHAYERGGPLSGVNFARVPERATRKLVADRGGPDRLAVRAVAGSLDTDPVRIEPPLPDNLTGWVYADLASLREQVRDVSVRVRRELAVTGVNAPAELRDRLAERRAALLAAPERYRSVADRVRVAARAAYLDHLVATYDRKAERYRQTRSRINDSLVRSSGVSVGDLSAVIRARRAANVSVDGARTTTVSTGGARGEGRQSSLRIRGSPVISVDGAPSYLTLGTVGHERVPAVESGKEFRPLVAKNWNVFTMPYGDVVNSVVKNVLGGLLGSTPKVSVQTGALALARANRTLARANLTHANVSTVNYLRSRNRLQGTLAWRLGKFREGAREILDEHTDLDADERRDVVATALGRWNSTHERALAVVNYSAATAIADVAATRANATLRTRDTVELWLRNSIDLGGLFDRNRPARGLVKSVDTASRRIATDAVSKATRDAVAARIRDQAGRWYGRSLPRVPAGMPVVPVTGPPLFTFNTWQVQVQGVYARFTVRAEGSPSTGPDATVAYTRDGDAVAIDVDDDGDPDRLGRSSRIRFSVDTWVVVVVPPGPAGVGDVNGVTVETSPGWPCPGSGGNDTCGGRWAVVERTHDAVEAFKHSNETGIRRIWDAYNATASERRPAVSGRPAPSAGTATGPPSVGSEPATGRATGGPDVARTVGRVGNGVSGRQSLYRRRPQGRICSTRSPGTSRRRPRTSARRTPTGSPGLSRTSASRRQPSEPE